VLFAPAFRVAQTGRRSRIRSRTSSTVRSTSSAWATAGTSRCTRAPRPSSVTTGSSTRTRRPGTGPVGSASSPSAGYRCT